MRIIRVGSEIPYKIHAPNSGVICNGRADNSDKFEEARNQSIGSNCCANCIQIQFTNWTVFQQDVLWPLSDQILNANWQSESNYWSGWARNLTLHVANQQLRISIDKSVNENWKRHDTDKFARYTQPRQIYGPENISFCKRTISNSRVAPCNHICSTPSWLNRNCFISVRMKNSK